MCNRMISMTLVLLFLGWVAAGAQGGSLPLPIGFPPPTYDPPPASTLTGGQLNGYEVRVFQTHGLTFDVAVPSSDLQQLLPNGYTPIEIAPSVSVVTVSVAYQQRSEVTTTVGGVAPGSYGPSSRLDVLATVRAPEPEVVILVSERSTRASVELANALFGEGSTRLADRLHIEIEEEANGLRFSTRATDKTLGLDIRALANVPAAMVNRQTRDPLSLPIRFLNGFYANTPFQLADRFDYQTVPTLGNLTFQALGNELRLPAGNLRILGIRTDTDLTVRRWREEFIKLGS